MDFFSIVFGLFIGGILSVCISVYLIRRNKNPNTVRFSENRFQELMSASENVIVTGQKLISVVTDLISEVRSTKKLSPKFPLDPLITEHEKKPKSP